MNLFYPLLFFVLLFFNCAVSESSVGIGHSLMVEAPLEYRIGFTVGGFLLENDQTVPKYRVALSIEAIDAKFACSLLVFLGDVKVWDSGHYSKFYVTGTCLLEFTMDGDLRLKGPNGTVGWKTGTSGQGVQVKNL